jgi:polyferredoxin
MSEDFFIILCFSLLLKTRLKVRRLFQTRTPHIRHFQESSEEFLLGALFSWKLGLLITVIVLSVLFYRPFCKWLCPLGAFYALLNKVSLFGMKVDKHKCVSCGKCAKACKMDVDVTKAPDHTECIRCGMCVRACPTKAVSFRYGFGNGKETDCPAEKTGTTKQISDTEKEQTQ